MLKGMAAACYFHRLCKFHYIFECLFLSNKFGFDDSFLAHNAHDFGFYFYDGCDGMRDVGLAAALLSERGG